MKTTRAKKVETIRSAKVTRVINAATGVRDKYDRLITQRPSFASEQWDELKAALADID